MQTNKQNMKNWADMLVATHWGWGKKQECTELIKASYWTNKNRNNNDSRGRELEFRLATICYLNYSFFNNNNKRSDMQRDKKVWRIPNKESSQQKLSLLSSDLKKVLKIYSKNKRKPCLRIKEKYEDNFSHQG